ncbi:MAG: carbohydrate ABC transporter substrate-binding protein [Tissierellia bacterium]|nr:carbohydrate ABC transporter substrate-binding protein [Tissierellia bacterium]
MKKFFSLFLVLILLFSVAACGNKEDTPVKDTPEEDLTEDVDDVVEEPVEGSLSVQAEEEWKEYYEAAIERFVADNPGTEIELKVVASFDHLDVIDSTDPTNEDVADIFALPADRLFGLIENEVLAAIDAKSIAGVTGGFSDYDAGLGGAFSIDGEYFAFPMNIETLIAYANTANAQAVGLDLDGKVELNALDSTAVLLPSFDAWFGVAVTNSSDIELLGQDNDGLFSDMTLEWDELSAEKQATFEELYTYWKNNQEAGNPMWDAEAAWGYMDSKFMSGENGVLRISGPWDAASFSEQAGQGEDLAILPLGSITVAGKELSHWKGGWGLGINVRLEDDEERLALAEAFIAELMNPEYAVEFYKAAGKIMENVDASVYASSDLPETDKLIIDNVLASYEDAPARPLFTEWGHVWDTWKNGLLSWSAEKPESAQEGYELLKASFDAMMMNF